MIVINTETLMGFTEGESYEVIVDLGFQYRLVDDFGMTVTLSSTYFTDIQEIRNEKLKDILE